jgi:hypothetical protein
MSIFEKISSLYQSVDLSVAAANAMDAAYCAANPEFGPHEPFTTDNWTKVSQNLAGVYAADAATVLTVARSFGAEGVTEARYAEQLRRFARDEFGEMSGFTASAIANVAWRSGNPFRGPDRLEKPNNCHFLLLPPEELEKDKVQIRAGAQFLCGYLGIAWQTNE